MCACAIRLGICALLPFSKGGGTPPRHPPEKSNPLPPPLEFAFVFKRSTYCFTWCILNSKLTFEHLQRRCWSWLDDLLIAFGNPQGLCHWFARGCGAFGCRGSEVGGRQKGQKGVGKLWPREITEIGSRGTELNWIVSLLSVFLKWFFGGGDRKWFNSRDHY